MTPFRKMQGLGNDFVVLDARSRAVPINAAIARHLADRHFGIGCDTVVLITPGTAASDAGMRFFNADGGEIETCGNATRCVARLLMDERGLARVRLDSKGGTLFCEDAGGGLVTVDMGVPETEWAQIPMAEAKDTLDFPLALDGGIIPASAVRMGNPHCVLFVEDAGKAPVTVLGPRIEMNPLFPSKVNVEFVEIKDRSHLRMRVWERGVGVTLACGSGACASLVAAVRKGLAERKVEMVLDGGTLILEWRESDGHVLMTGPGVTVFEGQVELA